MRMDQLPDTGPNGDDTLTGADESHVCPGIDDWALLRQRDHAGLRIVFTRHKDYVFRLAWGFLQNRSLAEDVTQEVFLRIAKGRSRWRRQARFTTWLYQVTLNVSREFRRAQQRTTSLDADSETADEPSIDGHAGLAVDLRNALNALSDRQREVVLLRYYEGLSTAETAKILRCRQGTVKSHLHRATLILQQQLEDSDPH